MGIVEPPTAGQRQQLRDTVHGLAIVGEGIQGAAKLRALMLTLVCQADHASPPRDDQARMFEDFALLEGHPHVRRV